MDFTLLPPEVNSGRMYAGPGSAPMLAAATAWDALAGELHSMAAGYTSAVTELAAGWTGPSAAKMTAAAAPYTAWLHTTAARAEQSAAQGRAAAAAYEAAFAATVPPPMITANRSLLAALVATNLLGQNAPAIAAAEAHYAGMWAQDAVAMCGYAGAAASAAQLTPFGPPPQTVAAGAGAEPPVGRSAGRLAGSAVHNQLSKLMSVLPGTLHNLTSAQSAAASPGIHDGLAGITGALGDIFGPYSPLGHAGVSGGWFLTGSGVLSLSQNIPGVAGLLSAPKPITGMLAPLAGPLFAGPTPGSAGLGGGAVSAAASRAGLIGGVSVPPAWTAAAPAANTLAAVLPSTEAAGAAAITAQSPAALFGGTAAGASLAGRALDAAGARSIAGAAPRTIGTAAACVGSLATDGVDTTVTIVVIPPPAR